MIKRQKICRRKIVKKRNENQSYKTACKKKKKEAELLKKIYLMNIKRQTYLKMPKMNRGKRKEQQKRSRVENGQLYNIKRWK